MSRTRAMRTCGDCGRLHCVRTDPHAPHADITGDY